MISTIVHTAFYCSLAFISFLPFSARAADPVTLGVNAFPNAKALPLHVGVAKGIFAKHGFKVDLSLTDSSQNQRNGLAAGKFQIVHSAVDNAIAMIEGAKQDVVIVSGGDSGMNEFIVQAGINRVEDLRGKIIVVDAPDTAYALQAKKFCSSMASRRATTRSSPWAPCRSA